MTTARKLKLRQVLRPVFRRHVRRELNAWAAAIRSARPPKDGGIPGGSLSRDVKRVGRVKKWGYVLQLHKLGQKLTWFVRGKKGQRPRPIEVKTDTTELARELEVAIANELRKFDRSSRA